MFHFHEPFCNFTPPLTARSAGRMLRLITLQTSFFMATPETAVIEKAQRWLQSPIDDAAREEIRHMMDQQPDLLSDAFYKDLEFGTGGLRGTMGIGSNRMNKYTVGMATQGLANYLKASFPGQEVKVAIAYDCRNNSPFFGDVVASVFSANGIRVFIFPELRPTPQLSFAVRELGCQGGVVITASHNPKEYNGYKAYWSDGGQLVPPHDKNVIAEVNKISGIEAVKFDKNPDLITFLGPDVDDTYLNRIAQLSLAPDAIQRQKDLKIVYSSIHGTGITLVPKVLAKMGFANVNVVQEQAEPNGNFPTVVYPNPEEKEAMTLALNKAKELDADLILATDPDSDRVGIGLKNPKGEFQLLNGNQTGSLLVYYLLRKWKENGKLDGRQYVVSTIVTTDLIDAMAAHFGVKAYKTLTGFKWIAEVIRAKEGQEEFIGGGEESYGYLISDFVRDKDAIASCAMIAEMVAYAKDQGLSLFDFLIDMYAQFGFYLEDLISITKKGQRGAEEIKEMMATLRANPPATIAGSPVVSLLDYENQVGKNLQTGESYPLDFPKSDVLQFITAAGAKISARPSGTEPKIKFYFSVNTPLASKDAFYETEQSLRDMIQGIIAEMNLR